MTDDLVTVNFSVCHMCCVFVLSFEFVQHGPTGILLIVAVNWNFKVIFLTYFVSIGC